MTTQNLIQILKEAALYFKADFAPAELYAVETNQRTYLSADFSEFKRDLTEAARKVNLAVFERTVQRSEIRSFIQKSDECIALLALSGVEINADLVVYEKSRIRSLLHKELVDEASWGFPLDSTITLFVIMPYKGVVSDFHLDHKYPVQRSPLNRFVRLLATERKEVGYLMIYSLVIGLLGLVLPLGLQSIIELISGGVFFSSVYVLIGLVMMGLLLIGVLQIIQISMVEHLQRRIFAKAAFEFSFRIPRIRLEALTQRYAPELINRFFDVTTIQKSLPKILLDLSASAIQIFFGLMLLSLYHPFFVFLSLFLVGIIIIMFYFTGPRGLESSLQESKYKYRVVQWLEELARTIKSFKLAGNTDLPVRKTDYVTNNYIKYRKKHFGVLLIQFSFFVFFKVAIAGGLLIAGTMLVVNRELTLGQFVASEVVIILVLNAIEKIILTMDVVYDLLTAVEKVSHVTDLPIERTGGFDLPVKSVQSGYRISTHRLSYQYPDNPKKVLDDISIQIEAGEHVCISGPGGSGKSTLANVMAGLYTGYTGGISVNDLSIRDLDLTNLRDRVAKNISPLDIFEGTLYENITIGKSTESLEQAMAAIRQVGLQDYVASLPEGLHTQVVSGGKGLSSSTIHRLILARCLAKDPELIILNDFFSELRKADKLDLMKCIINPEKKWTLLVVSNDPLVMASCDRVIVLDHGKVIAAGGYEELLNQQIISKYFE